MKAQKISPDKLSQYIEVLEGACKEDPDSADLLTCLGMAHNLNEDRPRSLQAFERARAIDPQHFFAQFRYAELLFATRDLGRAEAETERALSLARSNSERSMTRRQLRQVRQLLRTSQKRPA